MMPTEYNRTKIAGSGRNYQMPMIISPFNNYIINLASSFLPFRIFDLLLPCQSVIGRKKESSLFWNAFKHFTSYIKEVIWWTNLILEQDTENISN